MKTKTRIPKIGDRIRVTAEDSDNARLFGGGTAHCLVATAARRTFPGKDIICGYVTIAIGKQWFRLSDVTARKIGEWEQGKPVKPFSLTLLNNKL